MQAGQRIHKYFFDIFKPPWLVIFRDLEATPDPSDGDLTPLRFRL